MVSTFLFQEKTDGEYQLAMSTIFSNYHVDNVWGACHPVIVLK